MQFCKCSMKLPNNSGLISLRLSLLILILIATVFSSTNHTAYLSSSSLFCIKGSSLLVNEKRIRFVFFGCFYLFRRIIFFGNLRWCDANVFLELSDEKNVFHRLLLIFRFMYWEAAASLFFAHN